MTNKYIKSPINYTGNKYRLLDQIIPLFPKDINTFIEPFGGAFNVGINVEAKKYLYNDINIHLKELLEFFNNTNVDDTLYLIDKYIEEYNLSKTNKEGFLALRESYNSNKIQSPAQLYVLLCYCFNNQLRFNKQNKFNSSFDANKSSFNPSLKKRLIEFCNKIQKLNISFYNLQFESFLDQYIDSRDFVYCDPPYLGSVATYNNSWNLTEERKLLFILTDLDRNGKKFALSNNLNYENPYLMDWAHEFNIHELLGNYNNCNYQKKDKENITGEILITNY